MFTLKMLHNFPVQGAASTAPQLSAAVLTWVWGLVRIKIDQNSLW